MEHLKEYIEERKAVNGFKFYDHSLWPFLDEHKGKKLKNIKSSDLKIFLENNDFEKKDNWSEHANQYNITKLGKLLTYIKKRLYNERPKTTVKGFVWINNGETHKRIKPDQGIPEGWSLGLYQSYKDKIRNTVNATKHLYKEKQSQRTREALSNPETKLKLRKAAQKRKGTFYITNGIINKRHRGKIPKGWTKGLTRK